MLARYIEEGNVKKAIKILKMHTRLYDRIDSEKLLKRQEVQLGLQG